MNAAIAMRTNAYGQTVLNDSERDSGEHIEIDGSSSPDTEFQPHISASGELVHNQSVINSPTLQRFLENYSKSQNADKSTPEPVLAEQPVNMLNNDFASVSDIDAYAKEFDETEDVEPARPSEIKTKRTFASRALVRFCTECGFSFNTEKFCPHCGQKRVTYSAPNS